MFNTAFYHSNILKATYLNEDNVVFHSHDDKPAVYYTSGAREWYKEGVLHRDNDLPALIYKDKTRIWYQNGEVSRINGPAIIWYNNKVLKTYCYKGKLLNPYKFNIEYPEKEEEKLEYFNTIKFIIHDEIPYIFNEYVIKFDKKFYSKYKILLS